MTQFLIENIVDDDDDDVVVVAKGRKRLKYFGKEMLDEKCTMMSNGVG